MSNPFIEWHREHVDSLVDIVDKLEQDQPTICGGDTETTGLHIKRDKAFLIIFGWLTKDSGRVFTFYPTSENMKLFFSLAKKCKLFIWWNTKYDMHMMTNIGWEYDGDNLCEGMALARASFEAVPAREGGDSLALKSVGVKYVHADAANSEQKVKEELKKLNHERIKILSAALKQFPLISADAPKFDNNEMSWEAYLHKYGAKTSSGRRKYWGKGAIEKFLKDPTQDVEDLPKGVREVWTEWQEEYPEPTYADVDRELMIQYAGEDVITMLEFARKAIPIVTERQQWDTVKREMEVIKPLYRMERVGIRVDRDYLLACRKIMKDYITKQRSKMYELAGDKIDVGQGPSIIKVFMDKWGIQLEASDKPALKYVMKHYTGEAKRYAELIKELRTLEKWYSTYLNRILDISEYDGRYYTQIAQCSAVSGRVGSDGQQFPKKGIKDENGMELFNPRKCFIPTDRGMDSGYHSIYYLDFSQIELRCQSNYTLLVSGGDLNMCRAYMPFKCSNEDGEFYDFRNVEKRKEWNRENYWFDENGKVWTPTDVHSATTMRAFPDVDPESDEFKDLRSKGKMFNFMRNYGGGKGAAMAALDISEEMADALVRGYSEAFPHVLVYQDAVISQHRKNGYVQNMYGRRYYLKDTRRGYKLANYLVQGTCADMLKECIIEVDKFLLPYKTRFQMNIHDELSFEVWKGEEYLIPKIRDIMQTHDWHLVPIVSDVEVTYTNWSEKKDVKLEELKV